MSKKKLNKRKKNNNSWLKISSFAKYIRKDNKSAALVLTLIVISISLVISMVVSQLVIKEMIMVRKSERSIKAFYAAQAGMEEALNSLKQNPDWTPSGTVDLDDLNPDDGKYTITIQNDTPEEDYKTINSEGEAYSVLRTLSIEVNTTTATFLEGVDFWGEIRSE